MTTIPFNNKLPIPNHYNFTQLKAYHNSSFTHKRLKWGFNKSLKYDAHNIGYSLKWAWEAHFPRWGPHITHEYMFIIINKVRSENLFVSINVGLIRNWSLNYYYVQPRAPRWSQKRWYHSPQGLILAWMSLTILHRTYIVHSVWICPTRIILLLLESRVSVTFHFRVIVWLALLWKCFFDLVAHFQLDMPWKQASQLFLFSPFQCSLHSNVNYYIFKVHLLSFMLQLFHIIFP